jgi:hypothetical protein
MDTARKIIIEVPAELLKKAQRDSGSGITQTVRTGLEHAQLRELPGGNQVRSHVGGTESRPVIAVDTHLDRFPATDDAEDTELLDGALQDRQGFDVACCADRNAETTRSFRRRFRKRFGFAFCRNQARVLAKGRPVAGEGLAKQRAGIDLVIGSAAFWRTEACGFTTTAR